MLNRSTKKAKYIATTLLLLSGTALLAQQDGMPPVTAPDPVAPLSDTAVSGAITASPLRFFQESVSDGLLGVTLGEMAQQKASSAAVKDFGTRMVKDHSEANTKLTSMAARKGINLSTELMPEHQALIDKLTGLSGEQFDKEYMAAMTNDHTSAVQNYELQAKIGVDAETRDFANETLPVLREHLKIAKDIAARQGVDGR